MAKFETVYVAVDCEGYGALNHHGYWGPLSCACKFSSRYSAQRELDRLKPDGYDKAKIIPYQLVPDGLIDEFADFARATIDVVGASRPNPIDEERVKGRAIELLKRIEEGG